jgi:hypothetical protein
MRTPVAPVCVAVRVIEVIVRIDDADDGKVGSRAYCRVCGSCALGYCGIDDGDAPAAHDDAGVARQRSFDVSRDIRNTGCEVYELG